MLNVNCYRGMPPYLKSEVLNKCIIVVCLGFVSLARLARKDRQGLVENTAGQAPFPKWSRRLLYIDETKGRGRNGIGLIRRVGLAIPNHHSSDDSRVRVP